jgi:hypothetical protein
MPFSRRTFHKLGLGTAAGAAALLPRHFGAVAHAAALKLPHIPHILSAMANPQKQYGITDMASPETSAMPMGGQRWHSIADHPNGTLAVAVARRPGTTAVVFHPISGKLIRTFHAAPGRHFYGHSIFSDDGNVLFSTENDYNTAQGQVVMRDVRDNFRVIREFSSGGIGPHDIRLTDDDLLVVANGGLQTHPDHGRKVLNIETMAPNITRIDPHSGHIVSSTPLPAGYTKLSSRHISRDPRQKGPIVFGMQDQYTDRRTMPLVAMLDAQASLKFLPMEDNTDWAALHGYVGSLAVDKNHRYAAATSPRGGQVAFWDLQNWEFMGYQNLPDVCGLAPLPEANSFLVSSGLGVIAKITVDDLVGPTMQPLYKGNLAWDNHMTLLRANRA